MQYVFLKTCTVFCSIRCQCDAAGERANAIFPVQLIERGFTAVMYLESRMQFWSLIFKKDEPGNDGLLKEKVMQREKKICVTQLNDGKKATGVCPVC